MVWWFGGLVVWWFGGLVVWWFGGLQKAWGGNRMGLVVGIGVLDEVSHEQSTKTRVDESYKWVPSPPI